MTGFSSERKEFFPSLDSSCEPRRRKKRREKVEVNWRTFPFSREKAQNLKRQLESKVYVGLLIDDEPSSQKLAQIGGLSEKEAIGVLHIASFWEACFQEGEGGKHKTAISLYEEASLQEEREATPVNYHDIKTCLAEVLSVLEDEEEFTFGEIIEKIFAKRQS